MVNMSKVIKATLAILVVLPFVQSTHLYASADGLITIDAGHGYYTAGKRAYDESFREWEINDKVTDYVMEKLTASGYAIERLDDETGNTDVSLESRLYQAVQLGSDLHISVHQNASGETWNDATGVEVYYSEYGSYESKLLAETMSANMSYNIDTVNRGAKPTTYELFITREFTHNGIDVVLAEGLFMSNKADVEYMQSDEYVAEYGDAIVKSIDDVYGRLLKSGEAKFIIRIRENENDESLNIRKSASFDAEVVGEVFPGEVFTIVEVKNGLGKLSSGKGWISLHDNYVERINILN